MAACRGHRIAEDLLPRGEREITRDHHRPSLVAVSQETEQHLHLLPTLLNVADVIDDHYAVVAQLLQCPGQLKIPLRPKQVLHEQRTGAEQHRMPSPDQLMSQGTEQV